MTENAFVAVSAFDSSASANKLDVEGHGWAERFLEVGYFVHRSAQGASAPSFRREANHRKPDIARRVRRET